jgi:hypothetical protein
LGESRTIPSRTHPESLKQPCLPVKKGSKGTAENVVLATKQPNVQRREIYKYNYCKFKGHTEEFYRRKNKDQAEGGHMKVLMAQTESEEISIIKEEEKGLNLCRKGKV